MEQTQNINTKIKKILYGSEKRALSAGQIAEEVEFSRQYVDRQLRRMAENNQYVGRVELGPSVGYYWIHDSIELLDADFEGWRIGRPVSKSPMPVPCLACGHKLSAGDDVLVIFERPTYQWEVVQTVCADHLDEERIDNYIDAFLPDGYFSESVEDVVIGFAAVYGTLTEGIFEDQRSGREFGTHIIEDVSVLQLIRPRETPVGPDFEVNS